MISAPPMQHVSSGGLALAVHALFLLGLMMSVSWKTPAPMPVEAELWAALPELLAPTPAPQPVPAPPASPPAPPPAAPGPPQAEIALQQARAEQAAAARAAELARQEAAAREQAAARAAEQARQEAERAERARIEQIKQELQRRQLEAELARQAQADLAAEAAQLRAMQVHAGRHALVVEDFRQRIQAKVLSHVRLPRQLSGNPEAVFQVTLFANGEVREVRLVQPSGQPAYDAAVERAILQASPLPLPAEREAAAAFRGVITMKFRPFPDGPDGGTEAPDRRQSAVDRG